MAVSALGRAADYLEQINRRMSYSQQAADKPAPRIRVAKCSTALDMLHVALYKHFGLSALAVNGCPLQVAASMSNSLPKPGSQRQLFCRAPNSLLSGGDAGKSGGEERRPPEARNTTVRGHQQVLTSRQLGSETIGGGKGRLEQTLPHIF